MSLADLFVGVRPRLDRDFNRDLNRQLSQSPAARKAGEKAGKDYSSGFGTSAKRLAAVAGGAFAALRVKDVLKSSIMAASDMNETLSKSQNIFGKNAASVERWSDKSAKAFGLSKSAALAAASQYGNMFLQLGFTGKAAEKASTGLVKTAADLGSFNNVDPSDVLDRIGASLRGEYDSLQQLIPNINAARVEGEAMRLGLVKRTVDTDKLKTANLAVEVAQRRYTKAVKEHGKDSDEAVSAQLGLARADSAAEKAAQGAAGEISAHAKAQATLSIIQRDGAKANNDFAETAGGLANTQRILSAQWADTKVSIGKAFLPAVLAVAHAMSSSLLPAVQTFAERSGPKLTKLLARAGGLFGSVAGSVHDFLDGFRSTQSVDALGGHLNTASKAGIIVRDVIRKIGDVIKDVDWKGIGSALAGSLSAAKDALGKVDISKLGDGVSKFVKGLASVDLSGVTSQAGPFSKILGFVGDHMDTIVKLLPLAVAAFVAYKAAQAANNVVGKESLVGFGLQLAANATLMVSNFALAKSIKGVSKATEEQIVQAGLSRGAMLKNAAASALNAVKTLVLAAAQKIAAVAQKALNLVMSMNPLARITLLLFALAAGLVYAYKHSETFRKIVDGALRVVAAAGKFMWEKVLKPTFRALVDAVKAAWGTFQTFRDTIGRVWDRVKDLVRLGALYVELAFVSMADKIVSAAAAAFGWVPGIGPKLRSARDSVRKFKDDVNAQIKKIKDKQIKVDVTAHGTIKGAVIASASAAANNARRLGDKAFVTGGPVRGPGTGTSDSIPARLSNGEHVWTAREVRNAGGHSAVKAMRSQFAFADGGPVVTHLPDPRGYRTFGAGARDIYAARATAVYSKVAAAAVKRYQSQTAALPGGGPSSLHGGSGSFTPRFAAEVVQAQKRAGVAFQIFQRGFRPATSYSGTSHAGDAIDTGPATRTVAAALRSVGIAAWVRTRAQGYMPHVHGVPMDGRYGTARGSGIWQGADYKRGGNGLGGRDDMGRVKVYDDGGDITKGLHLIAHRSSKPDTAVTDAFRRDVIGRLDRIEASGPLMDFDGATINTTDAKAFFREAKRTARDLQSSAQLVSAAKGLGG